MTIAAGCTNRTNLNAGFIFEKKMGQTNSNANYIYIFSINECEYEFKKGTFKMVKLGFIEISP